MLDYGLFSKKVITVVVLAVCAIVVVWFFLLPAFRETREFNLLCPESLEEYAESITAGYEHLGEETSIQIVTVSDDSYTPEAIAQRLGDGSANLALLTNGLRPADLDVAGLHNMRSLINDNAALLTFSAPGDQPLEALPLYGKTTVMLFHPEMLGEMGGHGPTTWDDFLFDASCLAEAGIATMPRTSQDDDFTARILELDACMTYGAIDKGEKLMDGDTPSSGYAAYCQLEDFFADNPSCCLPIATREEALAAFAEGRCAMLFATTDEYRTLLDRGIACSALPIPGSLDEPHAAFTPTCSLVAASSVNGEEADHLFAWMLAHTGDAAPNEYGVIPASFDQTLEEYISVDNIPIPVSRVGDYSTAILSALWQAPRDSYDRLVETALAYQTATGTTDEENTESEAYVVEEPTDSNEEVPEEESGGEYSE